jgi:hypothetical protein
MSVIKSILMAGMGLMSAIYLANIGVGVVEIIPDNLPLIGNIDEAIATLLLLNSLSFFGVNLRKYQQHNNNANNKGCFAARGRLR